MRKTIVLMVALLLCGICVQAQSAKKVCPFSGKVIQTAEKATEKKACSHAHQATDVQAVKAAHTPEATQQKACPHKGSASYANYKAEGKNCPHARNATYANYKEKGKSCPHAAKKASLEAAPTNATKKVVEVVPASY